MNIPVAHAILMSYIKQMKTTLNKNQEPVSLWHYHYSTALQAKYRVFQKKMQKV